jgi:hypothetical protein
VPDVDLPGNVQASDEFDADGELRVRLDYDTAYLSRESVAALRDHFNKVLADEPQHLTRNDDSKTIADAILVLADAVSGLNEGPTKSRPFTAPGLDDDPEGWNRQALAYAADRNYLVSFTYKKPSVPDDDVSFRENILPLNAPRKGGASWENYWSISARDGSTIKTFRLDRIVGFVRVQDPLETR